MVLHQFAKNNKEKDTLIDGLTKPSFSFIYKNMDKKYYVYILLTERETYYCGYTDDVEKRFHAHVEGKGAKYTKANKPVKIVYQKEFPTKSEAMKEEARLKKLTHKQKTEFLNFM